MENEPSLVNQEAAENWIFEMKVENQAELDELMNDEEYEKFLEENQH